jgi:hypothetical protein
MEIAIAIWRLPHLALPGNAIGSGVPIDFGRARR